MNGGADWDLCDFVRKSGRAQTWNNISRWVYGIYHSGRDIPWSDLQDIDNVFRQDYLQSICAVNVKKRSGKSEADNGLVYRAGERYREQLRNSLRYTNRRFSFAVVLLIATLTSLQNLKTLSGK